MYQGAMALVALGVGYLTFAAASKEKEGLKLLGQAIGIFVMIAAFLLVLCSAAKCAGKYSYGKGSGNCQLSQKAPLCPMGSKMEHSEQ